MGVIGCACIMTVASLEVIQFSVIDLIRGFKGARAGALQTRTIHSQL